MQKHELDVIACIADDKFIPLIVRGQTGNPLTQNLLSKDKGIWKEVNQMTESEILKCFLAETSDYMFLEECEMNVQSVKQVH